LSTHNLFCRKFTAVCLKIATSCPAPVLLLTHDALVVNIVVGVGTSQCFSSRACLTDLLISSASLMSAPFARRRRQMVAWPRSAAYDRALRPFYLQYHASHNNWLGGVRPNKKKFSFPETRPKVWSV